MAERLVIDGRYGEGGGQILRSVLTLSTILSLPVRIENVRANRPNPGLAAQHLTAVRAAAAVCGAQVAGDALGSRTLEFTPQAAPQPGVYNFDVAAARKGGSAGAAPLVVQTLLPPLALARSASTLLVRGGTHVEKSPSFDYLDAVWRPALAQMGLETRLTLLRSGWFPVGEGALRAWIDGRGADAAGLPLRPFRAERRGALREVWGRALAANLPARIPQRMADRARALLEAEGIRAEFAVESLRAACPGAGLILIAHYEGTRAGFTALGKPGKPSEAVAEEAVAQLLEHRDSGATLERHLADQILVPAALAGGRSTFSVETVTPHLTTNAWVIERFGLARVEITAQRDGTARVGVAGAGVVPRD